MAYEELKGHGVTAETPKNIMLGAGTIHKGFAYTPAEGEVPAAWNFEASLIGATTGGNKLSIVPEIYNVEVDGAWVKTKGMTVKTGETATLEVNFAELTPELVKMALVGAEGTSDVAGLDLIESKATIEAGDYVEDLAFVGKTLDGDPIIVIFDNALCTSGLELEGKSKEASSVPLTFECYADTTDDLRKLPYRIYTPTVAAG